VGLATIARTQAEESFKQGVKVELVLRDQAIVSIRAAEDIGLAWLSTVADVTVPLTPKLPGIAPVANLDTMVKAGFDVAGQLLSTERKLAEAAVAVVMRQVD